MGFCKIENLRMPNPQYCLLFYQDGFDTIWIIDIGFLSQPFGGTINA
jgi:hypothetical protein